MIIVDYSGVAMGAMFSQDRPDQIEEALIRHMILNTIRKYNVSHRDEYGKMIIACDNRSWRKNFFPEYKAKRDAGKREADHINWARFYELLNMVKEEITENLPWPTISIPEAEADDIIGVLVRETQTFGKHEPVLIISSDKDFIQLQKYGNVKQYSPILRKYIGAKDPNYYLFEHICKGDSGDGVPNILSADNTFVVEDGRQKPLRTVKIREWWENKNRLEELMPTEVYRNYTRNKKLIDLQNTPLDIKKKVCEALKKQSNKMNNRVLNYLIKKRCGLLTSAASDFFIK